MLKQLTIETARKNVGKHIDEYKRMFGNYPMKIIEINGEMYVKDTHGVCMKVEETGFNVTYYDYISEQIGGADNE